jgi:hypothetical protein
MDHRVLVYQAQVRLSASDTYKSAVCTLSGLYGRKVGAISPPRAEGGFSVDIGGVMFER